MSEKPEKLPPVTTQLVGLQLHTHLDRYGADTVLTLGRNCTALLPARLEFDGAAIACDKGQVPMGFIAERMSMDAKQMKFRQRVFIPLSNVADVIYDLPTK